jgi:hypothetical protein
MSKPPANHGDPRPEPPERPLPSDCCEGGCDPCVHDLYQEALEHYEQALARWRARQPPAGAAVDDP